ncbi:MAG: cellulose synthase operon protein YhjQ [Burkholderiaceae bacterium]|nr:cellulose synthase operon protein YhjQ [Burkholderiaceae bacterium]
MHCIAIVSPLGGSGRTTLVAHLASLLHQSDQPCLAVDLSPQNHLGMYLGQIQPVPEGWGNLALQDQWWASNAFENSNGVGFLPFGVLTPEGLNTLQQLIDQDPQWLVKQLQGLEMNEHSRVFLDTPAWPAPLAQQAMHCADLLLFTLDASLRACQSFDLVTAMLSQASSAVPRGVLLTGFDARRESHRTVLRTLRQQWGDVLLPYVLHDDESIPAAQAQGTCVNWHAPHAQSAHDLQGIAGWVAKHSVVRVAEAVAV